MTLLKPGKLQQLAEEISKTQTEILAVQEVRWPGGGQINKKDCNKGVLSRFYFCRVALHVSGASAYHQEYLKLVRRPLVHVLSLQVSHHITLLGPELKTCTVLHQVGVSFDLYYDARKHKIKNKGVLCVIHTVEHNCIYVLVYKENNNYMFRSYLWTIFRLSINLQN